ALAFLPPARARSGFGLTATREQYLPGTPACRVIVLLLPAKRCPRAATLRGGAHESPRCCPRVPGAKRDGRGCSHRVGGPVRTRVCRHVGNVGAEQHGLSLW